MHILKFVSDTWSHTVLYVTPVLGLKRVKVLVHSIKWSLRQCVVPVSVVVTLTDSCQVSTQSHV